MSSRLQLTEAALVTDAAIQGNLWIGNYNINISKEKLNDIIKNY